MSVLIKGMKMPNGCHLCPFANEYDQCCINAFLEDQREITHYCHLVELPDHGDLIDRDALDRFVFAVASDKYGIVEAVYADDIAKCPVVIPAERSE